MRRTPSFCGRTLARRFIFVVLERSKARDHLANERTWLAYLRTSLAIASTGVGGFCYSPAVYHLRSTRITTMPALVQLFTISASSSSGQPSNTKIVIRIETSHQSLILMTHKILSGLRFNDSQDHWEVWSWHWELLCYS